MKEREHQPAPVLTSVYMGDARQPSGPKRERRAMTPAWKQLVLDRLAANKLADRPPSTLSALAREVDADKRGIYETFKPDQLTSVYVDAICDVLQIDAPSHEPHEAADLEVRALSSTKQDALLAFTSGLTEQIRDLPAEKQQPIRSLITKFLRDFFADE